jgi:tetratricopeptide (TPR) repeat protein
MAKKKSNSEKSLENDLRKLYDHIDDQNFENIEDLQAFLKQIAGKKLDEIVPMKKRKLSKKEESRELVYEAYETTIGKGRKLVQKAIKLDPDNTEAYNYLGNIEQDVNKAAEYYKKGMIAGKKEIGEKDFEEMKGHFWGLHQTRPFMNAKAGYAECLYLLGKVEESINQYAEMIVLNPNDNQGVRYQYGIMLVNHDKFSEYEALRKLYGDEELALWLFTYAIYLFKKEGETSKSNKALLNAHESNNHVILFLVGEKKMPDVMPDYYGWGDENEAIIYLRQGGKLWMETDNALKWAYEFYEKRKRVN